MEVVEIGMGIGREAGERAWAIPSEYVSMACSKGKLVDVYQISVMSGMGEC
jgi:hypothetical protein